MIGSKVDKDSITFELEHDSRVIARNTGSTAQKVEEMMRYFVAQRLFESTDNVITCLAMAKRLDKSMTSNPQMRDVIGALGVNKTVKEGYVYFILNKNNNGEVIEVKVGRSANPSARFAEHKKKYEEFGFDLEMVKTIKTDDCVALETEIHRKLKDYQIRKEWFLASEHVINLLRHDYDVTTTCKIRIDKIRLDELRLDELRSKEPGNKLPDDAPKKSPSKAKGLTEFPDGFEITESMVKWFTEQDFKYIDLGRATDKWVDAMKAKGSRYKDWTAAWRNGMNNAEKWSEPK